jgi:hypothetical protein
MKRVFSSFNSRIKSPLLCQLSYSLENACGHALALSHVKDNDRIGRQQGSGATGIAGF